VIIVLLVPSLIVAESVSNSSEVPSTLLFRTLRGRSDSSLSSLSSTTLSVSSIVSEPLTPGSDTKVLLFVQLEGPVTSGIKSSIAEIAGTNLGPYIPLNTFLLVGDYSVYSRLLDARGVKWVGSFSTSVKLAPEILSISSSGKSTVKLVASFLPVSPKRVLSTLREIGVRWANQTNANRDKSASAARFLVLSENMLQLTNVPSTLAVTVAFWIADNVPDVHWVEPVVPVKLMNTFESGIIMSGDPTVHDMWTAGLTGTNQIIAVQDSGLDYDSCFFRDPTQAVSFWPEQPNFGHRKVVIYVPASSNNPSYFEDASADAGLGHGTHVAGIVAGRMFSSENERGIAYNAKLAIFDVFGSTDTDGDIPASLNMESALEDFGAAIQSNSWGCGSTDPSCFTYDQRCALIDLFTYNHDEFLPVYAAGNLGESGSSTVVNPCLAKNTLCVGATSVTADSVPSWSSRGPTIEDGRFKPDVLASGSNVVSARSDGVANSLNCDTTTKSGTSMAAPLAAGAVALIRQYFSDGFYPWGSANTTTAFIPPASLLKAMVIHSGSSIDRTSTPDYSQGFGLIQLDSALYFPTSAFKLHVVHGSSVATMSDYKLCIHVRSRQRPLKVTLVWTDYPATAGSAQALVNDLDLQVWMHVTPGAVLYPNGRDTADRVNNVEQVYSDWPDRGLYTIIVRGRNVPEGDLQKFSLVVTGLFEISRSCPTVPASTNPTAAYPPSNTTLSPSLIVFEPPNPEDDVTRTPAPVRVVMAPSTSSGEFPLSMNALIGVTAGGGIFIAVLLVAAYAYVRSRSARSQRMVAPQSQAQPRAGPRRSLPSLSPNPSPVPPTPVSPDRMFYSPNEWGVDNRRKSQPASDVNIAEFENTTSTIAASGSGPTAPPFLESSVTSPRRALLDEEADVGSPKRRNRRRTNPEEDIAILTASALSSSSSSSSSAEPTVSESRTSSQQSNGSRRGHLSSRPPPLSMEPAVLTSDSGGIAAAPRPGGPRRSSYQPTPPLLPIVAPPPENSSRPTPKKLSSPPGHSKRPPVLSSIVIPSIENETGSSRRQALVLSDVSRPPSPKHAFL